MQEGADTLLLRNKHFSNKLSGQPVYYSYPPEQLLKFYVLIALMDYNVTGQETSLEPGSPRPFTEFIFIR